MKLVLDNRIRDFIPRLETKLFPPITPNEREIPILIQVGLFVIMTAFFSLVGVLIPANEYLGYDWMHAFRYNQINSNILYYPPWTSWIIDWLNWPLLVGTALAAYMLAVIRRAVHPLSALAAIITLQLSWAVFLGQMEGLVLVGLLGLPWLAPWALIKPQISVFAFFSRKSYLIAGGIILLVSILIWGLWPLEILNDLNANKALAENRGPQDISIGLIGIPLTLVLMWFSRGDMDMLMLAGATCVPYLIPYHLMPVAPAIARLRPWKAVVAGLLSWLPFRRIGLGRQVGGWGGCLSPGCGLTWLLAAILRHLSAGFSSERMPN